MCRADIELFSKRRFPSLVRYSAQINENISASISCPFAWRPFLLPSHYAAHCPAFLKRKLVQICSAPDDWFYHPRLSELFIPYEISAFCKCFKTTLCTLYSCSQNFLFQYKTCQWKFSFYFFIKVHPIEKREIERCATRDEEQKFKSMKCDSNVFAKNIKTLNFIQFISW